MKDSGWSQTKINEINIVWGVEGAEFTPLTIRKKWKPYIC